MQSNKESIIKSSLRAFLVSFFAVVGVLVGLIIVALLIGGIFSTKEEATFSSKVKILPDADGNRKNLGSEAPVLLQITLDGIIGKESLTGGKIENILLDSREDEFKDGRVKGILLVINSPGGSANDSDIIYRHLKHYKETYKVPIYAYINGMGASGGYYIAVAADKIFTSDTSLVGSIGVLSWPPFINLYDALEKLGINSVTVFAGKGKDKMNPLRPWKADEQKNYQQIVDFYYERFVHIVGQNRPQVNMEQLIDDLGAGVFPAPRAEEYGLIDGSDYSRSETIRQLAKAADIKDYQVISFEAKSWWKKMFKQELNSPLLTGKIKHEISLPHLESSPFSYL